MDSLLIGIGTVVILGGLIAWGYRTSVSNQREMLLCWGAVAEHFGLKLETPALYSRLTGEVESVRVEVDIYQSRGGHSERSNHWTRVRAWLEEPSGLLISPRQSKSWEFFHSTPGEGWSETSSGVPNFDKRFTIHQNFEGDAGSALTAQVREQLEKGFPSLQILDSIVVCWHKGIFRGAPQVLIDAVSHCLAVARLCDSITSKSR